jgi:hypothetical protein
MPSLRLPCIAAVLIAGLSTTIAPALAADVSMAGGVRFATPDGWTEILATDGDPEIRAFQVPDPSPTGHVVLARVTVTVKQMPNPQAFAAWVSEATAKAAALPGYQPVKASAPDRASYVARESGVAAAYREMYWYHAGYAIQLRCLRPQQSQAGAAWIASFDRGCDAVAARLK